MGVLCRKILSYLCNSENRENLTRFGQAGSAKPSIAMLAEQSVLSFKKTSTYDAVMACTSSFDHIAARSYIDQENGYDLLISMVNSSNTMIQ